MTGEAWRRIEGFDYEVSNLGDVRRIGRVRLLAQYRVRKRNGVYMAVDLWRWNRRHHRFVHRLVAAAFLLAPRPDRREVNHWDLNTLNNVSDNLEWCTPSENCMHREFMKADQGLRMEEVPA